MKTSDRGTAGFTLIEMMIVLAIIGVFAGQAVSGYAAWKRTTSLQDAVSMAVTVMRRAYTEARTFGRPYRLSYDARTKTLEGCRCEPVSAGAGETHFVPDLSEQLPSEVELSAAGDATQWLLDAGGTFLDPSGKLCAQQQLELVLTCRGGGEAPVRFVRLNANGRLLVSLRREAS